MNMDINTALNNWIGSLGRELSTQRAYKQAVKHFIEFNKFPVGFDTKSITIEHYEKFLVWSKKGFNSKYTRALYVVGVTRFLRRLFRKKLSYINPEELTEARREGVKPMTIDFPQFPMEDIEKIITYFDENKTIQYKKHQELLRFLRDRALILTLADTGLRIHEACNLRRGDIDWNTQRAVITGKGDKQAVVRFSDRAIEAIKTYLMERGALDGDSGKPLRSLPLFSRHNLPSKNKIHGITTCTGRVVIEHWVCVLLGENKKKSITPHSFRHRFVTEILRKTKNLRLAQVMARHSRIITTELYTHLLDDETDKAYDEIFNGGK